MGLWYIELDAKVPGQYVVGLHPDNRRRMIVMPFRSLTADEVSVFGQKIKVSAKCESIARQLNEDLTQTRRFTMLDREFNAETQAELNRLNLENASAGDFGRFQQLLVTDYMVIGSVKMYSSPGTSYNQWTGVTTANDGPFLEIAYRVILVPTTQLKWAGTIIVPYSACRGDSIDTALSTRQNIAKVLPQTDMILNCVKWPKGCKEYLVTREMLRTMEKGSVLVDISNDDQGAIETFHETTHENPRYVEEGVVHFCVSNIPGAIAQSTSISYAASVIGHFRSILNNGVAEACVRDGFLRRSLTCYKGLLTHEETSALQNKPWIRPEDVLGIADRNLDPAPPATVTRSSNFYKK